jgi:hypothetical protein
VSGSKSAQVASGGSGTVRRPARTLGAPSDNGKLASGISSIRLGGPTIAIAIAIIERDYASA